MFSNEYIYDYLVRKNEDVRKRYEQYVIEHIEEHKRLRFKHWLVLLKLNWFYRVRKSKNLQEDVCECNQIDSQINKNDEKSIKLEKKSASKLIKNNINQQKTLINEKIPIAKKIKLPYLNGSESMVLNRTRVEFWTKGLFDYDIISFDVFDTLLLRKVNDPKDIFLLLGKKHNIIDFYRIRKEAERDARAIHKSLFGNTEINIFDIYELIEKRTGLDRNIGIEAEFAMECEMCYANPYMKRAFNILRSRKKKIYVLSDMYFPNEYIRKLLEQKGYKEIEEILVSCDYNGGKKDEMLYKILKNKVGDDKRIVHIGDNKIADIDNARKNHIDTRYFENVQNRGDMYRENGMSPLIRAAYRGIVNAKLHIGIKKYSPQYEFGYIYGGIFVLGYVNWIHKRATEKGIDKILFLSRDGYIYKKVYDKLYSDIPSEYVYWSREASMKYACNYARADFLNRMIDHKFDKDLTIESMLYSIGLEKMCPLLERENLKPQEIIHRGNKKLLINFFVNNWEYMLELQKSGREYAKKFYNEKINGASRVALVDTGWRGDNQLGLKTLIEDEWGENCKVFCFMAATITSERNEAYMLDDILESYMFSAFHNRMLYDSFIKNSVVNMAIFEMFSQAPFPSFSGFGINGELKFGYAEVENYGIIKEILKGIEEFCEDYVAAFKNYEVLMNIPGYDAYIPFRGITRQYRVAKNAVGNVRFQQGIGIDYKKQMTETLLDIMSRNNI